MILTFTGDICITGSFLEKVESNTEIFSSEIQSELTKSSFVIGNLEGPTTALGKSINHNTPLKSPKNTINYLVNRNISIFNLANNHILDYGEQGLKETICQIKNEGALNFGANLNIEKVITPILLKKEGVSAAIFSIAKTTPSIIGSAQVFSSNDFSLLKKQIEAFKKKVDFIIINFHGGEEYTQFPSPVKRKFLKKIAALESVDCVIAHHSHTLQGYEKYKNAYIFYSLGNFIFDIPNHKMYEKTNKGALLKLHFSKDSFTFSFVPFQIKTGEIIPSDLDIFNTEIKKLSDFNDYQKKWQKDAFRVLFRKENPLFDYNLEKDDALQKKSFLSILFSKKFYKKINSILRDRYQFSIYFNAIVYKMKKKIS